MDSGEPPTDGSQHQPGTSAAEGPSPSPKGRIGRTVSWAVAASLPAVTVYVLYAIGWGRLKEVISSVGPRALAVPVVLYALLSVTKAVRWAMLVGPGLRLRDYYSVSSVHNLLSQVVPFGFGEFTFVYLFAARHSLPAGRGLVALGTGRLFDAFVLACLAGGAAAVYYGLWPLAIVAAGAVLGLGLLTGPLARWTARVAGRLSKRLAASRLELLRAASGPVDHAREALEEGLRAWRVLAATLVLLALMAAFCVALLRAFVPDIAPGTAVFLSLLVPLGTVVPLRGFGGFGPLEGLWMEGLFRFWSVPRAEGFAVGFGMHVVMLALAAASGAAGLAAARTGEPKRFDTSPPGGRIPGGSDA